MNSETKPGLVWRHPIATSLLEEPADAWDIVNLIDRQANMLLAGITKLSLNGSSKNKFTPIEKIAAELEMNVLTASNPSLFHASSRKTLTGFEVIRNNRNQHYHRQRFTLAHEIGHIILSRVAGPLSTLELQQAEAVQFEEEFLCDLFAASILMPRHKIEPYLHHSNEITPAVLNTITKVFRVSREAALRRIACLRRSILLFWNDVFNPRRAGSSKQERITHGYPNLFQLSQVYIPQYCTARDDRFSPNLILSSYQDRISKWGKIRIKNLGNLREGDYFIHNLVFDPWVPGFGEIEQVREEPRSFYNMVTLIDL